MALQTYEQLQQSIVPQPGVSLKGVWWVTDKPSADPVIQELTDELTTITNVINASSTKVEIGYNVTNETVIIGNGNPNTKTIIDTQNFEVGRWIYMNSHGADITDTSYYGSGLFMRLDRIQDDIVVAHPKSTGAGFVSSKSSPAAAAYVETDISTGILPFQFVSVKNSSYNDGIFECLLHSGGILQIFGNNAIAQPQQGFSGTDFIDEAANTAVQIIPVRISALYAKGVSSNSGDTIQCATGTFSNSFKENPVLYDSKSSDSTLAKLILSPATNQLQFNSGADNTIISATAPSAGSITETIPDTGNNDTFVFQNFAQELKNKTLEDTTTFFVNSSDNSKKLGIGLGTATTGTTMSIVSPQTASRVLTLPDATDTLVARNTTDTLLNKTITDNNNTIAATSFQTNINGSTVNVKNIAPTIGQALIAASASNALWTNLFKITSGSPDIIITGDSSLNQPVSIAYDGSGTDESSKTTKVDGGNPTINVNTQLTVNPQFKLNVDASIALAVDAEVLLGISSLLVGPTLNHFGFNFDFKNNAFYTQSDNSFEGAHTDFGAPYIFVNSLLSSTEGGMIIGLQILQSYTLSGNFVAGTGTSQPTVGISATTGFTAGSFVVITNTFDTRSTPNEGLYEVDSASAGILAIKSTRSGHTTQFVGSRTNFNAGASGGVPVAYRVALTVIRATQSQTLPQVAVNQQTAPLSWLTLIPSASSSLTANQLVSSDASGYLKALTSALTPSFTSETLTAGSNQLTLGTANTITLNAVAPTASRTYTIPDSGANSSFVMTDGGQTINGTKTFSSTVIAPQIQGNLSGGTISLTNGTNLIVGGNLFVNGTTSQLNVQNLSSESQYIIANNQNVLAASEGGMLVNTKNNGSGFTLTGSFTAGVASTSNPTVGTTAASGLTAHTYIQITGSSSNNEIFEVLSHTGNVLTICGVGVTAPSDKFTSNQFISESAVGTATPIQVSAIRMLSSQSTPQFAQGTTAPVSWSDFGTAAGSVTSLTGTTNQITVSSPTGAVTLSLPSTVVAPGSLSETSGFLLSSQAPLAAAGSTQGTAAAISKSYTIVTPVSSGQGVILPSAAAGRFCIVLNSGSSVLNIYPPSSWSIDALSLNTPTTLAVGGFACYISQGSNYKTQLWQNTIGTANQITASTTGNQTTLSLPSQTIAPGTLADTTGMLYSTATGLTAVGTSQGTALALTKSFNVVSSAATGTGVVLPAGVAGFRCVVTNQAANAIQIYPASGAKIDSQSTNQPVTLSPNASATYQCASATQWYTVNTPVIGGSGISVSYSGGVSIVSSTLSSPVSVSQGGTNSSTALSNNRYMISSGGAIVESQGVYSNLASKADLMLGNSSYSTGTASQSGATVTGSGTSWLSSHTGGLLVFASGLYGWITSVASGTSLTLDRSQTQTSTTYTIYTQAQVQMMGNTLSAPNLYAQTVTLGIPRSLTQQAPINLIVPGASVNSQVSFYNSSDSYPKYVVSPYSNDNIFTTYDASYSGTSWVSSSAGGAFCFNKNGGQLHLQFSNAGQGSNVTWTDAMLVDKTTGMSALQWSAGGNLAKITMANVGYTGQNWQMPSVSLNGDSYMMTQVLTSNSATSSGAIAHSFTANFSLMNSLVCMTLKDTSAQSSISTGNVTVAILPTGLRPSSNQYFSCVSLLDSTYYPTNMQVLTTGNIVLSPLDGSGSSWSTGHTWQFQAITIIYAL